MKRRRAELQSLLSNRPEARISEAEWRRRKEAALAKLRELEVAQLEGRVIQVQVVVDAWTRTGGRLRDAILAVPDKAAPLWAAAQSALEAREILRVECEAVLRTLAEDLSVGITAATLFSTSDEVGKQEVAPAPAKDDTPESKRSRKKDQ